jgi:hypothetical protein
MKDLFEKLSSYNIFNYLFPGVLFAILGEQFTSFTFVVDNIVLGLFLYYFFGLVISRIGSLIVQPILEHLNFTDPASYSDFVSASQSDEKLSVLSQENNMYRTLCALFLCLLALLLFSLISNYLNKALLQGIVVILLCLLFALSYRKQTRYIKERTSQANSGSRGPSDTTQ